MAGDDETPRREGDPAPTDPAPAAASGSTTRRRAPFVRTKPVFHPSAVVPMAIAGLAGAVAWAAVLRYTEHEVGYVAWGLGLLVGLAGRHRCAGSNAAGFAAAGVTIVSILAGKWLGVWWLIEATMSGLSDVVSPWDFVKDSLAPMDLLFAGLGLWTAFQTVAKEPAPARRDASGR